MIDDPLSSRVADISATIAQAIAVLEIVGAFGETNPTKGDAIYGAATIMRAAADALGEIELEARNSEREGGVVSEAMQRLREHWTGEGEGRP